MKKLLSFVIALAMVIALVPMSASAEEVKVLAAFTTFNELKELIANAGSESEVWYYEGSEDLVITEDITLPENVMLQADASSVVAAEGTTLTNDGDLRVQTLIVNGEVVNNNYIFTSWSMEINGLLVNNKTIRANSTLTVNGKLVNNGEIDAFWELTGSGAFENAGCLTAYFESTVVSVEQITHTGDGYTEWICLTAELAVVTEAAQSAAADPDAVYYIILDTFGKSAALDSDMTVPENTVLTLRAKPLTVPAGNTLTINGELGVNCTVNMEGTLVNNGYVVVDCSEGMTSGLLNMDGTYTGKGDVWIDRYDGEIDVETAAPGLDVSYFSHVEETDTGWYLSHDVDTEEEPTGGEFAFSTYEELSALLEKAANYEYLYAEYVGEGPLVIQEDLTIPENVVLDAATAEVTVPENVTLTVDGELYAGYLTVDGAAVNNWYASAVIALTVNGSFENNYILQLLDTTTLTGEERIEYTYVEEEQTYAQTHWYMGGSTIAELKTALEKAAASEHPNYRYNITFADENGAVLTENLTVPANAQLALDYGDFTVAEGSTLTVDGILYVQNRMFVEGTLVNNAGVVIYAHVGSSLNLAQGGTYEGPGVLDVWVNEQSELETAITGLDLSAFDAAYYGEYREWVLTPKAEPHTHEWGEGAVTTPATCTTEGVLTYTCECGETKTEAIPATGHSFGEWVTVLEPTTTTEGKAERKCACGETESKTLPKLEARPRLGDVNNDGRLSAKDATMILRWVVRKLTDVPAHFEQVADVNDDGKISAKDATLILRFVVDKADIPGWER